MQRSTIIVTLCLVLSLGGAGWHFYSEHLIKLENERIAREVAVKVAADKEKKATEELLRLQAKAKEQSRRLAELELQQSQAPAPAAAGDNAMFVGPSKPGAGPASPAKVNARAPALISAGPPAGEPVPAIIPTAEKFIAEARLTSTSLDSAPYAVINRATYRVGNHITIAPGIDLTIISIDDGFVVFSGGAYKFKMRLTALNQ